MTAFRLQVARLRRHGLTETQAATLAAIIWGGEL